MITASFGLSLGVLMGVLNVFYRDVGHMMGIVMQFWFWATPIIYTKDILPERLQAFMQFNPAFPLIDGYHRVIYLHHQPDWNSLGLLVCGITLLAGLAYSIFRRAQGEIVDAL
jgi:lipopolysaccharide transport system permease protein